MSNNQTPWSAFSGPNLGYVMEQYDLFLQSPDEVDSELVSLFQQYGAPKIAPTTSITNVDTSAVEPNNFEKIIRAIELADAIRANGHLTADIYPLNDGPKEDPKIDPKTYGLTDQDLREVPVSFLITNAPNSITNGLQAIEHLKAAYTNKIAFEIAHIVNREEKLWLQEKIEKGAVLENLSADDKKALLKRLTQIEGFEKFIHRTFVGAKRFSIEGLDTLVVLMDELVRQSNKTNTKQVNIGMAHRGRLNVLTHVLQKPYEMMFAEFAHVPSESFLPKDGSLEMSEGWYGDVKYHKGAAYRSPSGLTLKLAYNPSHLEVVSPVVTGQTRAAQEKTDEAGYPVQDKNAAFAILVHGDAAFPGQGVVTEVLNYSRIRGFQTGGSIHIIANNMIGFTTEHYDSRSTHYSSDPAKGYEVPVIHVNADDPEAVLAVAKIAHEYRQKFGKDIVIDLLGYRRYGHNEMDEPLVTNPTMYHKVHKHPTVRELYGQQLVEEKLIETADVKTLDESIFSGMQAAYDRVKELPPTTAHDIVIPEVVLNGMPELQTGVEESKLAKINEELLTWPAEFTAFKKLAKILKRREEPFKGKGKIDWGHAETLAFATILQDGNSIRLTGQDAQRGTFSHRHLVLHDEKTGAELTPIHAISDAKASFVVHNSPLTEAAILGYEFGYNLEDPNSLSIWEAQYGDFANMAQVMFDNFISAARSKWGLKSGLVMLLPHAAEGQGAEHSSARPERYLQLAAENNWTVANLSSAANYFHILRRQAKMLKEDAIRPLIIVSPKSLLRHPLVGADVVELTTGQFETVLEQPGLGKDANTVEKIIFASGKLAIDLADKVKDGEGYDHLHIVRVEQLYPFPKEKIQAIVERYPNVKQLAWAQEEPENMGSWNFALPYLLEIADGKEITYVGRVHRSSPAEGDGDTYKLEQARIIDEALKSL
ncbi:2-oxoglutarate dehydrogenase E1 component [Psychrobacillus lasiicapitis]|uniref:2-oxoglutarate dehydrogenase E1 component n=1 Tax=Psychrobacillus lasiicapitis TaxID=1636719 RepID=A0A544TH54_9BACI|nr:2-oxoglutarate dehydrogenase E1 component [Psychrobacillus lasiicapitis]TQR16795.1 2-oxoglutarate dehydrogenase E1 component [Psychrobacillus lasiicapitis]GGA27145.1 2-oxoglutarate dehydrogenase E1 component [Psychrobacillus lasiicapitis]